MTKLSIAVSGFVCGIVLATALCTLFWFHLFPAETEVWTTSTDLVLEDNILIPMGVELIHDTWMPEGFATLSST